MAKVWFSAAVRISNIYGILELVGSQRKFSSNQIPSTPVSYNDTSDAAVSSLSSSDAAWEVVAYQKSGIGEGQYTANPWLQELPDAITKVCWDNYVTMAPADCYDLFNITGNEKGKWDGLYIEQETPVNMVNVTVGEQFLNYQFIHYQVKQEEQLVLL